MREYEFVEKIDIVKYKLLLSNFDELYHRGLLFQKDAKNCYRNITDYTTCKKILYHFLDVHDEDGNGHITYKALPHHPAGRLWSQQFSTQGISRSIRHTICDGVMVDLDIKNAHPTLLLRLCEEHYIPHPYLKGYVENRNVIIEKIINDGAMDNPEDVKRHLLAVMNGRQSWNNSCSWIKSFHNEMKNIRSRIVSLYPNEYKTSQKIKGKFYHNLHGSCLNLVLTTKEREILDKMMDYCFLHNIKIGSLCHDGLMLHYDKSLNYQEIAHQLSNYCGIEIVVKPMNEKIPLDGLMFRGLDYPYRNFSNEEIEEFRHLVSFNWNSRQQAMFFNKINDNYQSQYVFVRSSRSNQDCWFEKQVNGRWFESQSPFSLSNEIAIQFPPLFDNVIEVVRMEIKKTDPDDKKYKRLTKELSLLLSLKNKTEESTGRSRIINELRILWCDDHFPQRIDADPNLIAFENGVYDLQLKKFRAIGPNDYVQKSTGYNFPLQSNPKKREILIDFLMSLFVPSVARSRYDKDFVPDKDNDDIGKKDFLFLMIILSSCIIGGNKFQKFYMFIGDGANGKSVLEKLCKTTFGDYAVNIDISAFISSKKTKNSTSDLPRTKGCRILFTNESDNSDSLDTAMIKNITGNEEISEREVYKSSITFTPQFTPILPTNHAPRLKLDDAISRRIQMVHFPFRFFSSQEEVGFDPSKFNKTHFLGKDPDIFDILMDCADEFFLLLLEIYFEHVVDAKEIIAPDRHKKETSAYLEEQDRFKDFIFSNFQRTDIKSQMIKQNRLMSLVKDNVDAYMDKKEVERKMLSLGFRKDLSHNICVWNIKEDFSQT